MVLPLTRSGAHIGTVTKAMTDGVYKQAKAQGLKFECWKELHDPLAARLQVADARTE